MNLKERIGWFLNKLNLQIRILHPKEATIFAKNYFKNEEVIYAEIGVYTGRNIRSVFETLKIKKAYLIDPYKRYDLYESEGLKNKVIRAKSIAHRRLKKHSDKIVWIEEFSEKASIKLKPEFFDFIYIDRNHAYEFVKKDVNLYWSKLKKNGIFAGHDIDCKDVSSALIEFIQENKINPKNVFFGNRTDWWIIKK